MQQPQRNAEALDASRLTTLAVEIRTEVEAAEADFQSAVRHAIAAGEKLTEAKALVPHGQWLPWLEANFEGGERTAQNYMRLARNRNAVADLPSVREAVALLTSPRPEQDTEPDDAPDDDDQRLLTLARRMVEDRNLKLGIKPEEHPDLIDHEVRAQCALLYRRDFARALLDEAAVTTAPEYGLAAITYASVLLDPSIEPWGEREDEAHERWQTALGIEDGQR